MNSDEGDSTLNSGTVISHYRILQKIGSGGMGDIYAAEDIGLKRQVALKFLPAGMAADQETRRRFISEAQAVASLNHPNIITIFEVNEYLGRPFFAMEHIDGVPLDQYVRNEEPPLTQIIDITVQVCRGLKEAHKIGIIHRDIKPANVIIDTSGHAKILDFGLAITRIDKGTADLTSGTMAYMSPEMVQSGEITPASDLFSLGVMMYEMISGKKPFAGEYEASLAYAIVNESPPSLREQKPEIPETVIKIVDRLLEKKYENRFQNADDVINALQSFGSIDEPYWIGKSARRSRRTFVASAIIIITAAALIVAFWGKIWRHSTPPKVLAVLPFENMGDKSDEYFADGMTDAVTTHLAKIGELGVISRTSTMQYKNTDKNLKQIGFELGAEYIITGTIQWDKSHSPERVKISASLLRTTDDTYLWTDSYERVIDKVFALQSEIAENVTDALHIAVSRSELQSMQRQPTQNLAAYDFYLRGNEYFNRSWEKEDIEIAIGLYQKAIELDAGFASAYAMLSRAHGSMYSEFYDRTEYRHMEARNNALRALEIDPDLVEGHLAMGYCYYCELNYPEALREFAIVQKLQPNNRYLYNAIGAVQRRQGNLKEAVRNFSRALELDPLSYLRAFDVAVTYGLMRRYDEAGEYLDRTIMLAPDWPLPYVYRAWIYILHDGDTAEAQKTINAASGYVNFSTSNYYWWLARIIDDDYAEVLKTTAPGADTAAYYLHCAQMYRLMNLTDKEYAYSDSARALLEVKLQDRQEEARYHSYLGLAYAGMRQKEPAILHGRKALELLPTSRDAFDAIFLVVNLAETMVIFGEYDEAINQLENLLAIPGFISVSYLKLDPLWNPLHDNPRFQALLKSSA
ncbi:MAG: protein kinase [Candidatus Zixiibacteriota bacterium]